MAWSNGSTWTRSKKSRQAFSSHPRRCFKSKRNESIYLKSLSRVRRKINSKVKKIMIKLSKTKIKMHLPFSSQPLITLSRRLFIKVLTESGIFMMIRKENGFSKSRSQLKRLKRWNNYSLISWRLNYSLGKKIKEERKIINPKKKLNLKSHSHKNNY